MIDLTPIDKRIQTKLFEKMRLLSREGHTPGTTINVRGLTNNQVKIRTSFVRMTSGLEIPVILMGGELSRDKQMLGGYDEIYGPKTYYQNDEESRQTAAEMFGNISDSAKNAYGSKENFIDDYLATGGKETSKAFNKFKRPMPGLKSIDVIFKGGMKALREGTISWTCWSFEDINRLSPHFLSHGTTVMLEWGWVYGNDGLKNLPTLYAKDGIKRSAYKDYINVVREGNGDFDFMIGIVKNFEYTTRDDGGFDCQTIITSVGASMLNNPQPNKQVANTETPYYNIKKTEGIREIKEKILDSIDSGGDSLITHDIGVTMKAFLANIDSYVMDRAKGLNIKGTTVPNPQGAFSGTAKDAILYHKRNEWIIDFQAQEQIPNILSWFGIDQKQSIKNIWVRWGWFEDNILSKFLTLASDSTKNPFVTEFRSVEKIKSTGIYESVRIKNHPKLETTDINKYILPGQFVTYIPPPEVTLAGGKEGLTNQQNRIPGDSQKLRQLERLVAQNFKLFATKQGTITLDREYSIVKTKEVLREAEVSGPTRSGEAGLGTVEITELEKISEKVTLGESDEGYIRNMLINTKVIRDAIGIGDDGSYTTESINIREFLESIFSILNQDINFWNFEVTQDQIETNRSKIVDTQITNFNFKATKPINNITEKTPSSKSVYTIVDGELKNEGVFYFPVWQKDSLVKRQNITAKIPDAFAMSVMYGANYDSVKSLGNPPPEASSIESAALAGAFNYYKEKNKDVDMDNIDIALKKKGFETLGTNSDTDNNSHLKIKGGTDNILKFLNKPVIKDALQTTYEEKIDNINEQIGATEEAALDAELRKLSDPSVPLPLPNEILRDRTLRTRFVKLISSYEETGGRSKYTELYSSKYHTTGRMREVFINTISTYTSFNGTKTIGASGNTTKPIIIPLDIELDIDGIGGIIPGNSFHSTYLPSRYQEESVFQAKDINHKVDSSGWTVTLSGIMRSTYEKLTTSKTKAAELSEIMTRLLTAKEAQKQIAIDKFEKDVNKGLAYDKDDYNPLNLDRNFSLTPRTPEENAARRETKKLAAKRKALESKPWWKYFVPD